MCVFCYWLENIQKLKKLFITLFYISLYIAQNDYLRYIKYFIIKKERLFIPLYFVKYILTIIQFILNKKKIIKC